MVSFTRKGTVAPTNKTHLETLLLSRASITQALDQREHGQKNPELKQHALGNVQCVSCLRVTQAWEAANATISGQRHSQEHRPHDQPCARHPTATHALSLDCRLAGRQGAYEP